MAKPVYALHHNDALNREQLTLEGKETVLIFPGSPIMQQLIKTPNDSDIIPIPPSHGNLDQQKKFVEDVRTSALALRVTQATLGELNLMMAMNAMDFVASKEKPMFSHDWYFLESKAYIVGAGASMKDLKSIDDDAIVFVCWRASVDFLKMGLCDPKRVIVCHIDPLEVPPWHTEEFDNLDVEAYLSTPTATPLFQNETIPMVYYLAAENVYHQKVASLYGVPIQPAINGTVAHFMLQAAILWKFTTIKMIGVDLSWEQKEDVPPFNTIYEVESYSGKPVYMVSGFYTCALGIEELAKENPQVKITNLAPMAAKLTGIEYENH